MTYKMIMTNKEFQRLGKVPRVLGVYLLDDLGERIRRLPEGSEKDSRYREDQIEVVVKKPLSKKQIYLDADECLF